MNAHDRPALTDKAARTADQAGNKQDAQHSAKPTTPAPSAEHNNTCKSTTSHQSHKVALTHKQIFKSYAGRVIHDWKQHNADRLEAAR